MEKMIITVLGSDRPGIIAAVSQSLYELDCNIENVSQMVLQSEFAGLFMVTASQPSALVRVREGLQRDLALLGLEVHVKIVVPENKGPAAPAGEPFLITTTGPDAKGLVARITGVLARYGANVTNLKAVFKGGDDPGKNIMVYEVVVPGDADQGALYKSLRQKAEELGLEISIQHRKIFDVVNKI